MFKLFILAIMAITVTSSFAIFGFGFQGGVDITTSVDAVENDPLTFDNADLQSILDTIEFIGANTYPGANINLAPSFSRDKIEGLFMIGGKFFIDAFPVIDLEATVNVAGIDYGFSAIYPSSVSQPGISDLSSEAAFESWADGIMDTLDGSFAFLRVSTDITVRHTFFKLPPAITLVRIYAGAGPSFVYNTPLIDTDLFNTVLNTSIESGGADPEAMVTALADKIVSEAGMKTGGHIVIGAHVKPPIIPLYLNVEFKQYFALPKVGGENSAASVLCFGAGLDF